MSLKNERATRRVPHRAAFFLPNGFEEEEREIISLYHEICCSRDRRWLPVDKLSAALQAAIANWFAVFRNVEIGELQALFTAVVGGESTIVPECIVIPNTRSLVRLLYSNPPENLEHYPEDADL